MKLEYIVKFHPVGQGLFSSGKVHDQNGSEFNFMYDCGTSSKQSLLDDAISSLSGINSIDLLVISHFDHDHISGLGRLLKKCHVKTLLMPYIPLPERLFVALANNLDINDSFMNFYLDPVKFLMSEYNEKITQIVLVSPSQVESDEVKQEIFEEVEQEDIDEFVIDFNAVGSELDIPNAKHLKAGGRLVYNKIFEFIPYNDSSGVPKLTKEFIKEVIDERKILLSSSDIKKTQDSLGRIKASYDKLFGNSAFNRNIISLFLFAGSCLKTKYGNQVIKSNQNSYYSHTIHGRKNGILFTGDGYLNTDNRLKNLLQFLGKRRINDLGVFQVMHHGASANWRQGVARTFSPSISVFSSNPEHQSFQHPHAEVVKDFLPYHPVQVDEYNFFEINFYHW
ncbi:MBL fold metallo-hydrolase [Vibrio sp. WJH972]